MSKTHYIFADDVTRLEALVSETLAGAASGDLIEVTRMPIPGLDVAERQEPIRAGDGDFVWVYEAAVGEARARTDEMHRLAIVHPEYDGFITLTITARCDLDDVRIHFDDVLERCVTAHHVVGPLRRGQSRTIDLEIHPRAIAKPMSDGFLTIADAGGSHIAPPVRLTLATDPSVTCTLAGCLDGPLSNEDLVASIDRVRSGRSSMRRLARRIDHATAGLPDPGWSRLPWRK